MHEFLLVTFWVGVGTVPLRVILWSISDKSPYDKMSSTVITVCNVVYLLWCALLLWGGWK